MVEGSGLRVVQGLGVPFFQEPVSVARLNPRFGPDPHAQEERPTP